MLAIFSAINHAATLREHTTNSALRSHVEGPFISFECDAVDPLDGICKHLDDVRAWTGIEDRARVWEREVDTILLNHEIVDSVDGPTVEAVSKNRLAILGPDHDDAVGFPVLNGNETSLRVEANGARSVRVA